jgi:hypothetical protein
MDLALGLCRFVLRNEAVECAGDAVCTDPSAYGPEMVGFGGGVGGGCWECARGSGLLGVIVAVELVDADDLRRLEEALEVTDDLRLSDMRRFNPEEPFFPSWGTTTRGGGSTSISNSAVFDHWGPAKPSRLAFQAPPPTREVTWSSMSMLSTSTAIPMSPSAEGRLPAPSMSPQNPAPELE